jgi:hypothetical protein
MLYSNLEPLRSYLRFQGKSNGISILLGFEFGSIWFHEKQWFDVNSLNKPYVRACDIRMQYRHGGPPFALSSFTTL